MAVVNRDHYYAMESQANNADYRRREADQKVSGEAERLKALRAEADGMSQADLRKLQKKFTDASEDIQRELDALREEFGKQLGKQASENARAVAEIRRLANENKRDLDKLSKDLNSLEKKIKTQFEALAAKLQDDRKQALYCYGQLDTLVKQISELFPEKYELLYPDQLKPTFYVFQASTATVVQEIKAGHYEVAIGLAKLRIPEAIATLGLLSHFHDAFLKAGAETKQALLSILNRVDRLEQPKTTTVCIDGEVEYDDDHGPAYWARELYSEIVKRILESRERFNVCEDDHDTDGLTKLLRDIGELNEQLTACEQIEENERLLHYTCYQRAYQIYRTLTRTNRNPWSLVDIHINEEDLREPVYLILSRPDGYRATFTCIPERKACLTEPGTVRCELEVFDSGDEKDDLSACEINHKNIALTLETTGIQLCAKPHTAENIDSKTFVDGVINQEAQTRARWMNAAKEAIGLLEEI